MIYALSRNRQTPTETASQRTRNPPPLKACGFESHLRHHAKGHARRRGLLAVASAELHLDLAGGVVHEHRQRTRDPGELEELVGLHLADRDGALPGPEPFDLLPAIDKHPTAALGHDTEHVTFPFDIGSASCRERVCTYV